MSDAKHGDADQDDVTRAYKKLISAILKMDDRDILDELRDDDLRKSDIKELRATFEEEEERLTKHTTATGRIGGGGSGGRGKNNMALEALRRVDGDGDNYVDFEEFKRFMFDLDLNPKPGDIRAAWGCFNVTHKEGIPLRDFRKVFNARADIVGCMKEMMRGRMPRQRHKSMGNINVGSTASGGGGGYRRANNRGKKQPWEVVVYDEKFLYKEAPRSYVNDAPRIDAQQRMEMRQAAAERAKRSHTRTKSAGTASFETHMKNGVCAEWGVVPSERILIRKERTDPLYVWLRKKELDILYDSLKRSKSRLLKKYFDATRGGVDAGARLNRGPGDGQFRELVAKLLALGQEGREEFNRWDLPGVGRAKVRRFWNELQSMGNLPAPKYDDDDEKEYSGGSFVKKILDDLYGIIDDRHENIELDRDIITTYGAQQIVAKLRRVRDPEAVDPKDPCVELLRNKDTNELGYILKNIRVTRLKELFETTSKGPEPKRKKVDFEGFLDELKAMGSHSTKNDLRKVFTHIDKDRLGKISMQKFFSLMDLDQDEIDSIDYKLKKKLKDLGNADRKSAALRNMKNWNKMEVQDWILDQDLGHGGKDLASAFRDRDVTGKILLALNEKKAKKLELPWNRTTRKLLSLLDELPGRKKNKKETSIVKIKQEYATDVHDVDRIVRAWYGMPDTHWNGRDGHEVTEEVEKMLSESSGIVKLRCNNLDDRLPVPRGLPSYDKVLVIEYEPRDTGTTERQGERSPRRSPRDNSPHGRTRDRSPAGGRSSRSNRNRYDDELSPPRSSRNRRDRDNRPDEDFDDGPRSRGGLESPKSSRRTSDRDRYDDRDRREDKYDDRRRDSGLPRLTPGSGRNRNERNDIGVTRGESPRDWGEKQVGYWLKDMGHGKYRVDFERNGVDGREMLKLDRRQLEEIGVRDRDIDKLLDDIYDLKH